jgi:signal transduction histidine kinase
MLDVLLGTLLDSEQRENVKTSRDCASQPLDILNTVLSYSALQAENVLIESIEIPLPQLLESAGAEAKAKAESLTTRIRL